MNQTVKLLAELHKSRITFAVTLTTLAGFTLAAGRIDYRVILPLIGIFILASGASAFNQYQERNKDILMTRTKNRPIPSGRIKPYWVVILSFLEIIAGTYIVYTGSNLQIALLAFMAFIWYNLIYTPLKKITSFAVIPGSVIGAIPPMVGWLAGGGTLLDSRLFIMAFFFFMSQVPHFWLLMLKYSDEYKTAGFPVINDILNTKQIRRVTFVWIAATSINIILLAFGGLIETYFFKIIVMCSALWLVIVFSKLLYKPEEDFQHIKYFQQLNFIFLIVIIAMILDPLF